MTLKTDFYTLLGLPLPNTWRREKFGLTGFVYYCPDGLKVIESTAPYEDGQEWLHVSMSRKNKMPTYEDMVKVKHICCGDDRAAHCRYSPDGNDMSIFMNTAYIYGSHWSTM